MARILGVDYGAKRIGLALSDETRLIASPIAGLANDSKLFESLAHIVQSQNVDAFLVGKPLHEGENSFLPRVLAFARGLHRRFSLPVYLYDESLSSRSAREFLLSTGQRGKKLKAKLDSAAAQQILAEFLLVFREGREALYILED